MPAAVRRRSRHATRAPITLHEFEALDRTHADVLHALRQLEALVGRLEAGSADAEARRLASAICTFFDGTARAHHEDEERVVFPPLLASADPHLVQHVQRLQQDHGWIEEDWRDLRLQLGSVAEGYAWHDVAALRTMAEVFCALYLDHIALEESLIYPESKQRLVAAEEAAAQRGEPG
jgi:hemerythrin-like domain-containing protein